MQIWKCTNKGCFHEQAIFEDLKKSDELQCPICWSSALLYKQVKKPSSPETAVTMLKQVVNAV